MTPVQTHRSPIAFDLRNRAGHPDPTELRVGDDMTVEVALSVMAGAGVEHLLLCDADDTRTGSVTRAELVVHLGSSAYTDRVRLRDVLGRPSPMVGTPSFLL
ncbi:CBS domain-containing protein [Streptomyces sp. NPDC058954]|uniref:CBS domain-containing protein n=1 Tax=Streptomyces sp. NPDC058954 TaxID=3346677 RepID=UPI003696541E